MKKFFTWFIVLILTSFYAVAQTFTYHPDDKEGMRIFLRQPSDSAGIINAEQLGLQISDTLDWYNNDDWIPKVQAFKWDLFDYYRVVKIECQNKRLAGRLNGEKWPRLELLHCYDNKFITDIDVSKNVYLNHLACDNDSLLSLNITGAVSLVTLYCQNANLTSLDLSTNAELVSLDCSKNNIASLDISKCPSLAMLYCNDNQITALDVSNNPNLSTVHCENNQIATFDASAIHSLVGLNLDNNPPLTMLDCSGNKLSDIHISGNKQITTLYCNDNHLTSINLSEATHLEHFDCSNNSLEHLNITGNTEIKTLGCSKNRLSSLDIEQHKALEELSCDGNFLSKLDFANNRLLKYLNCSDNLLKVLTNIEGCPLEFLNCSKNYMLFSKLLIESEDSIGFIYSPQKVYEAKVAAANGIDLTAEYDINDNITTFIWYDISDKQKPISLSGQNGNFTLGTTYIGKTLRCKMVNDFFSEFGKDTLTYEVGIFEEVGIEDNAQTNIHIYPNPTDGKIVIQNTESKIEHIQLFDMMGRMVFETRQTTFDIAHLPTAVYFIQIRTNEGVITRKIMKQ